MARFCKSCGVQLSENASFCTSCGASSDSSPQKIANVQESRKHNENVSGALPANSVFSALPAAAAPGEFSPGNVLSLSKFSIPGLSHIQGPFRYLGSSFMRTVRSIKNVFKDKKLLIPVIVLAVTWLVLNLLPAFGVDALPVRVLSFLTFAKGGTSGGALDIAGGLAGKGIFAYFITSMVIPVFTRRKPSSTGKLSEPSKGGVSQFFSSLSESFKNTALLPSLLLGCAAALILYNFITGDNSLQKVMAGISAMLLSIRAASNKTGFLRVFLTSWINKSKGKKVANMTKNNTAGGSSSAFSSVDAARTAKRFIAGITLGFAVSIPLSAIGYQYTAYIAGAVLILASAVIAIVSKSKKEVAA